MTYRKRKVCKERWGAGRSFGFSGVPDLHTLRLNYVSYTRLQLPARRAVPAFGFYWGSVTNVNSTPSGDSPFSGETLQAGTGATDGGQVPHEYQIERRRRRHGPAIFIATDARTPGPTGVGATEAEAVVSLESALARWRMVEGAGVNPPSIRRADDDSTTGPP